MRSNVAYVFLIASIIAAVGMWEWSAGRPPLCPCGRIALWSGDVHGPENSQMVADWYSLSHTVHGLLFFAGTWVVARGWPLGLRLVVATAIEGLWEVVENSPFVIERYRAATLAAGYSGDSILNSLSDIGFMIVGFLVASRLAAPTAIALGIALELVALAVIRDNLSLNVLMLLYPLESIRQWQAG